MIVFLSLEFIEIDLFLLLACPTKILHPQSKILPLELSLSGCLFHCGMTDALGQVIGNDEKKSSHRYVRL